MKWVQDKTGRFAKRPHYLPEELDDECERIICAFLQQKYGRVEFPVKTDDLTVLIEQKADLDAYADLSGEEGDVQGVTEFTPGKRPVVRISDTLQVPYLENRLRTTLTHEWGHIHFHQFMFDAAFLVVSPHRSKPSPVGSYLTGVLKPLSHRAGVQGLLPRVLDQIPCRRAVPDSQLLGRGSQAHASGDKLSNPTPGEDCPRAPDSLSAPRSVFLGVFDSGHDPLADQ